MRRNRLLYFLLFILALTFVYFFGGKVPYMLFQIIVILPVISLLYTLIILFRFKYTQDTDKKFVTKGDNVRFIFSLNNEDIMLYPYVKVTFCSADTLFNNQFKRITFSLSPFGSKSYSFELLCKYRGCHEIGMESIEIEDFLGIFKFRYKVKEPREITVYPKIVLLDRFHLGTDYISESQSVLRSRFEDLASIEDVRKYAYGDSLKKIHWKLTAKTGKLLVKKYQSTSETSAILFLDLTANPFSFDQNSIIEDKLIEAAVAVLSYCVRNWIPVRLVYYEEGLKEIYIKNPLIFNDVYKILASIKFREKFEFVDLLDVYLKNDISKTNVVLFTSNISYELFNVIHKAKEASYNISLVYVSSEGATGQKIYEEENILSFLPEINVNTYRIDIEDDIKNVLESRF